LIPGEQLPWTAVQDRRTHESTSTDPGQKDLPDHKETETPVTAEAGTQATPVAGIRAHRVTGSAVIRVITDDLIQGLEIQDIIIIDTGNPAIITTDLGNSANIITIIPDLQIGHSGPDRDTVDNETNIITHQESGLPYRIITHIAEA
jgi:hypothetical protein